MRTVNEVSKQTGVSVRTLHYYDAIGLLKPTEVTEAGYRLYDDTALGRLQNILLFRELQFPLKEIKAILDSPNFDASEALTQQIELLELQHKRLGELIAYAREIQKKGVRDMNFQVFDKSELEQYKAEAKAKWGDTKAYQEYAQKQKNGRDFGETTAQMMHLFTEIGALGICRPTTKPCRRKSVRYGTSSQPIFTPARLQFFWNWGGCMSATSASGATSTKLAARARLHL